MRLTIIVPDTAVYIDGVCKFGIDMSTIPAGVQAVQWYESAGDVEAIIDGRYTNTPITSLAPYQAVIDQWYAM